MAETHLEHGNQMVDLREFLAVIRRHKLIVATTTFVMVALAVGLIARRTPLYSSTAEVEVRPLVAETTQYGGFYDLQSSMDTEAARMLSAPIAELARSLGAPADGSVAATVPTNTTFIDVTCTTPVAETAAACAHAYAKAYEADRRGIAAHAYNDAVEGFERAMDAATNKIGRLSAELALTTGRAERQNLMAQIEDARQRRETAQFQLLAIPTASQYPAAISYDSALPTEPSNKGYLFAALLALVVGFALGIGLAFLRDRLDERIGGRSELEQGLGVPVIALVPKTPGRRRSDEIVSLTDPNGAASEAYRTARTTLLYLANQNGIRVIAVTGPGQGEGKTTTTSNIAVTLAQSGKRVVVISGDLRRPTLHRYFRVDMEDGLSEVLGGTLEVPRALRKTEVPGLLVMPSGHVPTNPAELLASPAMDDVIEELRRVADFVLIDTPPALIVSDVLGLAPKVDGLMVVVDASSTPSAALSHLRDQIDRVGGTLIGSILNNLDRNNSKYYDTYGGYYMAGERYRAVDRPTAAVDQARTTVTSNGHALNGDRSNGDGDRASRRERKRASTAEWRGGS